MAWAAVGPVVLAAFLASTVEFVEALTIVLAVGATRGWRSALTGAALGALLLAVLVALFGPALHRIPITVLQVGIGVLLLLFGLRWLRKAMLRAAGALKQHDEGAIFERERQQLAAGGQPALDRIDRIAAATTFKAVVLEGLEVVFIVIAAGAVRGMLVPASLGAAAAGVMVIGLGIAVHRPLTRVPENALKYAVGVILASFGTFWLAEGIGCKWPGEDLALLPLACGYLLASLVGVALVRANLQRAARQARVPE